MDNNPTRMADQAKQNATQGIDNMADKALQNDDPTIQRAAAKAKEIASDLRSKDVSEIAGDAKAQAGELAQTVKDKASELGAQASDQADAALTSTGQTLDKAADTVRQYAPSGKVGEYAESTAQVLEKSADYLKESNVDDIRMDLEAMIRRRPVESLLVGLGIGFLLARAFRR